MKKIFLLAVTLSVVEGSFAQDDSGQYIRKGLLRSMATISPGIMLKGNMSNTSTISLHGNLEYYVAENVSVRGDSYYFLHANQVFPDFAETLLDYPILNFNHSTFAGVSYHFKTKNHFDPYFCVQPGISITQTSYCELEYPWDGCAQVVINRSINPLISSCVGSNFYFQKRFHLFGEARYISGKHLSGILTPLSLRELRFSFGLGFNLNLIKKK